MARLRSLRLEAAAAKCANYYWCCPCDLIEGVRSLVHLEQLHFVGFEDLGQWPAETAAALQPLHHLRALVNNGLKDYGRGCLGTPSASRLRGLPLS